MWALPLAGTERMYNDARQCNLYVLEIVGVEFPSMVGAVGTVTVV